MQSLPVNQEIKTISKTQQNIIDFKLIKSTLSKNHPELFRVKKSPLAHDIREQILDNYPQFDNNIVLKFLRYVFSTAQYLEALALNVERVRYNLNMTTTSFVSTEHRKSAANYLAGQLNNYRTPKGLKRFTTKERKELFSSLESLDHRFETERYSIEHEMFDKYLIAEEKSKTIDNKYGLSDSMFPDNF